MSLHSLYFSSNITTIMEVRNPHLAIDIERRRLEAISAIRDRFPRIFEAPNSIRTALVEAAIIKDLDVESLPEPNFARILLVDRDVEISVMANRFGNGEIRARLEFVDRIGHATKMTASIFSVNSDPATVEIGFYDRGHFSGIFYYPQIRVLDVRGYGYDNSYGDFKDKSINLPHESPFIRKVTIANDLLIVSHSFPERTNSGVLIVPTSLFLPQG